MRHQGGREAGGGGRSEAGARYQGGSIESTVAVPRSECSYVSDAAGPSWSV